MTKHEYFDTCGHLTNFALTELILGKPDELARLEIAEHLSFCDDCTERYCALLSGEVLMPVPQPMAPSVFARMKQQARVLFLNRYFSAGLAACLALVFWVTGVFSSMPLNTDARRLGELSSLSKSFSQKTGEFGRSLTDGINSFFDQFTLKEDPFNEKE